MDLTMWKDKFTQFLKKYRYVAIVLLVGLILMVLPSTAKSTESKEESVKTAEATEITMDARLEAILGKIEGAGQVRVMLSIASGQETIFQTNDSISTSNDANTTQIDTVIITDADRNQSGLIRQVNPPKYLGAIVICKGADSSAVRFALTDAVSKITGLNTNQISVLKMK